MTLGCWALPSQWTLLGVRRALALARWVAECPWARRRPGLKVLAGGGDRWAKYGEEQVETTHMG